MVCHKINSDVQKPQVDRFFRQAQDLLSEAGGTKKGRAKWDLPSERKSRKTEVGER